MGFFFAKLQGSGSGLLVAVGTFLFALCWVVFHGVFFSPNPQ